MSTSALFGIKTALALAVLAIGLFGALLPWALGARGLSDRPLALGDTFAGGVLGGAGLVHLLSDGIDRFRAALPAVGYPLALLLAGAGFLMILLIEGVVVAGREEVHVPGVPADRAAGARHEVGWLPGTGEEHRPTHPLVLLIVLSAHSVILGLALGAQGAVAGALVVFLAIVAHKAVAGFALGMGYRRAGFARNRAAPQVAFFAAMTPLGILAGSLATVALASHADQLFEAVFDSLGAGTFLYIATLDILRTEFDGPEDRWRKWLAASLGFGLMALLAVWV
ncbi:MAG TPA: ZIP family metal transporter [Actinomycetota bacterium]|nr:ZIP family metal transporter [Actinomycetota bacterium]